MLLSAQARLSPDDDPRQVLDSLLRNMRQVIEDSGYQGNIDARASLDPEVDGQVLRVSLSPLGPEAPVARIREGLAILDGEGVCTQCGEVIELLGDRFDHLRHAKGCIFDEGVWPFDLSDRGPAMRPPAVEFCTECDFDEECEAHSPHR